MNVQEGTRMETAAKGRQPSRSEREAAGDAPGTIDDLAEARARLLEKDATISELHRKVQYYETLMRALNHDLRNPLTSIVTATEIATGRVRDRIVQEALGRIDMGGRRLHRI